MRPGIGLLFALLGTACVDQTIQPNDLRPVDRVVLSAPQAEVLLDDSLRLHAIGLAGDGDTLPGRGIVWSSSDSTIVSVSAGGYAVGRGTGGVTIAATIEGQRDSVALTSVALTFASISAGANHACGLTPTGSAWCWGGNATGALGIGDAGLELSRSPRRVSGGLTLTAIAVGYDSSCGLTATGAVWCWGANSQGQLGNGTTSDQPAPALVVGGIAFATISRPFGYPYSTDGTSHMCGVSTAQAVYCWGANAAGQLGDGTRQERSTPVAVHGGHTFTSVTTGSEVSCGVDTGASAWCWGSDADGRLGHDTSYTSTVPLSVQGGTGFDQIASNVYGGQICGVGGGTLRCWGWGPMDYVVHAVPTVVPVPASLVSIAEGDSHACGLTATGQAWCWGDNEYGQLGTGSTNWPEPVPPTPVAGGLIFTSITAGWGSTCGLVATGDAYCWGVGALGTSGGDHTVPGLVLGGHTFAQISLMDDHACGVDLAGSAYCWGDNYSGQIGDGTTATRSMPTLVQGGLTFQSVAAGSQYTCGVASGAAYCWGQNYYGILGDGSTTSSAVPVAVAGGHSFQSVSPGRLATCGVEVGGAAYCWGWNDRGQLGDGSTINRTQPAPVAGGHLFTAVEQLDGASCGLATTGEVLCWGDNHYGQLGNGVTTDSPVPVDVQGGLSFDTVATGGTLSCGLTGGGDAYCWPSQTYPFGVSAPKLVPGGLRFAHLSVGDSHACGITAAGQAYCWGSNSDGQFGNGTKGGDYSTYSTTPKAVAGGHLFATISAGRGSTCGITTGGTAYCWGANWYGQLGAAVDDQAYQVLYPVKVRGQP